MTACLVVCLALGATQAGAPVPVPATVLAAAKAYGFTDAEVQRMLAGEVLAKPLPERSDKELAGVVAVLMPKPLSEFTDITLEGKLLNLDSAIRSLHVWKPDESADGAFAGMPVDAAQQAMLKGRYEAYRRNGLRVVRPAGDLLSVAINETSSLNRRPGYAKALLNFPLDSVPGMEHRFFVYQQDVEGRPALILSHRSAVRGPHDALITEQRYFVSEGYDCRFIASDCYEVPGGTLMFYASRVFTDRVAGVGSVLKHRIGRARLLADVAANQKRIREQLRP